MTTYTAARAPVNGATVQVQDQHRDRDQVLAWLRLLHARTRFFLYEIDYIGVNLKIGVISPEEALDWVDDLDDGLRPLVEAAQ